MSNLSALAALLRTLKSNNVSVLSIGESDAVVELTDGGQYSAVSLSDKSEASEAFPESMRETLNELVSAIHWSNGGVTATKQEIKAVLK